MLTATGLEFDPARRASPIFSGVSLSIEPGKSYAITGPSGTGKSSLLYMLGGLMIPSSGSVFLDGGVIQADAILRRSAWVTQALNAFQQGSVLANAAAIARIDNDSDFEVRAMAYLDLLGMSGKAKQRAKTLSGGELQRVVLARALTSSRRFMFLDEPTNQLDSELVKVVCDIIQAWVGRASGALILATHDARVADACDFSFTLTPFGLRRLPA